MKVIVFVLLSLAIICSAEQTIPVYRGGEVVNANGRTLIAAKTIPNKVSCCAQASTNTCTDACGRTVTSNRNPAQFSVSLQVCCGSVSCPTPCANDDGSPRTYISSRVVEDISNKEMKDTETIGLRKQVNTLQAQLKLTNDIIRTVDEATRCPQCHLNNKIRDALKKLAKSEKRKYRAPKFNGATTQMKMKENDDVKRLNEISKQLSDAPEGSAFKDSLKDMLKLVEKIQNMQKSREDMKQSVGQTVSIKNKAEDDEIKQLIDLLNTIINDSTTPTADYIKQKSEEVSKLVKIVQALQERKKTQK